MLVDQNGHALAIPLDGVDPAIEKAVRTVTEDFFEEVRSKLDLIKAQPTHEQPKSWFNDPFSMLDSIGLGYRASPSYLTYDTLKSVSKVDTAVAAIILTRVNQVAAFCRPQPNKFSVGYAIRPVGKEKPKRLTDSQRDRIHELETFIRWTGREANPARDSFETAIRKLVRDRLTYDQMTFEVVRAYDGRPHSFHAVAADTMRIAHPRDERGRPPDESELRREIRYVQVLNSQIMAEFTERELAFCVANPRTDIRVAGYGLPEIEMLMTTVTAHMWAEAWNRQAFSQGSTVKGVLNLQGNIPNNKFESFKRQWMAQVSGISNAWRTPVMNAEGLQWIPLQMNNTEMGYQMWMEYLIKITCAIYQIDPAEINFDLRGGVGQQPVFMSTNEAQQKVSKDRGLHPLLRFFEDAFNRYVIWPYDPRYEFAFVGIDAKTEEQAQQLRIQQVQNTHTLNEARALEDLPPIKEGDIVLNPTYTGYLTQKAGMEQQQAMMAQQGGQPGQPGGDQGQPGQPPDPNEQKLLGGAPGEEEEQARDNLHAAHHELTRKKKPESDSSEDDHAYVHLNDWQSSVHASLFHDLFKATYDTLETD